MSITKPNRDTTLLAPFFQTKLLAALLECQSGGYPIAVFEGYRGPQRQDFLYEQGRTRPGKRITNAKAWQSFHQYGVACDLAFYYDGRRWSWEGPWDKVQKVFEDHGFETISWERPHIQITMGLKWQEAYGLAKDLGLPAVWALVERRFQD